MLICLIPYSILMKVNKFLGLTYNRAMEPMIAQWEWYKRTSEISSMKRLKEENPFLQVEEQARSNHQEWWHHGHRIVCRRQYKSRCCKNGISICKLSKFQAILVARIKICFRAEWTLMTWWVRWPKTCWCKNWKKSKNKLEMESPILLMMKMLLAKMEIRSMEL